MIAAFAAVPAQAESDLGPLVEACEANAPSAAMCTGLAKVGERASAECRRLGLIGDAECYSQIGRKVIREEVGEHGASATHRALQFQYDLAGDVPLRNTPWIGTHNSFNTPTEDPSVSHTDSNQQLSLTEQLDVDVRSLELDIHWFPASARSARRRSSATAAARTSFTSAAQASACSATCSATSTAGSRSRRTRTR